MAELSEVESVLVSIITQTVYPNGTSAASAIGNPCKIFRGWPIPANLESDLREGIVNISVFPLDPEQNVTRYSVDWVELPKPNVTLTMAVSSQTVTVGGTLCCPLNAAVLVNDKPFVYPLQATDTTTSIATALAALINPFMAASSTGPVITIPGATKLQARVGAVGTMIQEVKRQKKCFRITIWCNDPLVRDAFGKLIDRELSTLTFLTLSDGSAGRIRYERAHIDDTSQKSRLYRRDLDYSVEYGTTHIQRSAEVVTETINLTGGLDPNAPPLETISF